MHTEARFRKQVLANRTSQHIHVQIDSMAEADRVLSMLSNGSTMADALYVIEKDRSKVTA